VLYFIITLPDFNQLLIDVFFVIDLWLICELLYNCLNLIINEIQLWTEVESFALQQLNCGALLVYWCTFFVFSENSVKLFLPFVKLLAINGLNKAD